MSNNMRKVVLTISSAKVVNTNLSDAYGKKKKYRETMDRNGNIITSLNDMDNIIHVNHIINALHVMLGARPVSYKYGNRNSLSRKIINIVENGILRYDNVYKGEIIFKNGNVKTVFCNEFTQGKKPASNSNRGSLVTVASNGEEFYAHFTWSSLYKISLYNENYQKLLEIINDYAKFIKCDNITKDYTLIDVLVKIKYENPEWIEKLQSAQLQISPVMNFFIEDKIAGDGFNHLGSKNLAGLGNINAPTPKVSVNATVILFMDDDDATKLLQGKRYATILDNGFIYVADTTNGQTIDNIRDFNLVDDIEEYIEDYLDEGFIKINTLPYTHETNKN